MSDLLYKEYLKELTQHLKQFLLMKNENEFNSGLRQCKDISDILRLSKKYKIIDAVETQIGCYIKLQYFKGYEQAMRDRGDLK